MKRKRPYQVRLGEVQLTRTGESVEIRYPEADIPVTLFAIGSDLAAMSDADVIELWNCNLRARAELAAQYGNRALEIPLGRPQIQYHQDCHQWSARGQVLRCVVEDDENMRPVISIDDHELSWEEFGKLVVSYAGWGMRIAFVPEDEIHRLPKIEVLEPEDP